SLYISSDGRSLPMFFSFDALKNYSLNTLLYYVPSEWSNKGTVSTVNYNTSNNYVYNYISNYIQENPGIDLAELQALIDSLAGHLDNLADTIEKQVDVEKSNNKILKQIRDLLKTIAVLLGVSAVDPDPGEEDPDDDDTTSIATFILIFLIFVCLLSLLLKCVGLMFKVMVYITTIFGIPATQGTLPDSFVYGLRVFKGEVPIGGALSSVSNEYAASPLVMELGGVHISFYMLFVILFEIAFIGLTIKAVRKFAEKINFPKM
ncbi:MAG: hypothetical protein K6A74_09890, partial [Lachnospiraceae bacterium]|nr:hypothetical protein [Lachnospiraceae bacterium]